MRYNIYVGKKLVANMGEAQLQPYFIRNWDKAPLYLPIYPTDATGYSMQSCPNSKFIKFVNGMDNAVKIKEV